MSVMVWQVHLVRSGFFNAGSAMLWLQLAMIVFQKTVNSLPSNSARSVAR
jgi:hypothetical protein